MKENSTSNWIDWSRGTTGTAVIYEVKPIADPLDEDIVLEDVLDADEIDG